jgi:threonine synthase
MKKITYFSTVDPSERVSLRTAVLKGLAVNKGLYMPDQIPLLPADFFHNLENMGLQEIAFEVSRAMFGDEIPEEAIRKIVEKSLTYDIPLHQLSENIFVLELFHGPTLAFKDTGARFLAALFEHFLENEEQDTTIIVATSGDTGSAVANAFFGSSGIKVVILYPSGRVSKIQEKMLTSMGGNISAVEVAGDFDDCQRLVKECFSDRQLSADLNLTSANSINFARLFPQSFYYFHAIAQLRRHDKPVVVSVPCGNFGNLTAGVMASKMGLEIRHFIASANANHQVVDYLGNGTFIPGPSIQTLTNAMDVGDPSNFPRLLQLFGNDHKSISSVIKGWWFNDSQTIGAMRELHSDYGYQSDPHGAVAYLGLKEYLKRHDAYGIFLETAHPAKFQKDVEKATESKVVTPDWLSKLMLSDNRALKLKPLFNELKDLLMESIR